MGITNSIRVRKTKKKLIYKMKFSTAVMIAVASAEDKKVPPRHPLQRLAKLTEFSAEILNEWYTFLPSKDNWVAKFTNDVDTMMKTIFPMVVQNVNDVKMMIWTDTTVKTQSREPSKSLLVSANGLRDTSH